MPELQKISKDQWLNQGASVYTDAMFDRNLTRAVDQGSVQPYTMTDGQDLICHVFTRRETNREELAQIVPVVGLTNKQISQIGVLCEELSIQSSRWPTGYLIQDSLDLWHHPYRIPPNTTIDGDLLYGNYRNLRFEFNEPTLDFIPENLTVNGKLSFQDEKWVAKIGRGLTCHSVVLNKKFDEPIEELTVTERLRIDYNLPKFGKNCYCKNVDVSLIQGDLSFKNLTVQNAVQVSESGLNRICHIRCQKIYLSRLTKGRLSDIQCQQLEIKNSAITALESNIQVSDLYLSDCHKLHSIRPDIVVKGSLIIKNCVSLSQLPKGLIVGSNLEVQGDSLLKDKAFLTLPQNGLVHGSMTLPKKQKNKATVPESFCCLGQIHWAD